MQLPADQVAPALRKQLGNAARIRRTLEDGGPGYSWDVTFPGGEMSCSEYKGRLTVCNIFFKSPVPCAWKALALVGLVTNLHPTKSAPRTDYIWRGTLGFDRVNAMRETYRIDHAPFKGVQIEPNEALEREYMSLGLPPG